MIEFKLPDMSCGGCAGSVKRACAEVDPQAQVRIDVGAKRVEIESSESRAVFEAALAEAGFPPAKQ